MARPRPEEAPVTMAVREGRRLDILEVGGKWGVSYELRQGGLRYGLARGGMFCELGKMYVKLCMSKLGKRFEGWGLCVL